MPRHHFVPAFILRNFASAEAWRLRAPGATKRKVAENDKRVLQHASSRSWPLCVLDKGKGRIERRVLRDVCSLTNFYALPEYEDPVLRGIVRHTLRSVEDPDGFIPMTDFDLAELGQQPLDKDEIEKLDIAPIDGQFARLVDPLREGEMLSSEELDSLLKFIALARYRTPTWREVYYPEIYTGVQNMLRDIRSQERAQGRTGPSREEEESFDNELEKSLYQMALVQACLRDREALARANAKVVVLHSVGSSRFVASDNPARPYFDSDIRTLPTQRLPGISNPDTQAVYPLAPDTCLLVSTSPELPRLSHEDAKGNRIRRINTVLALSARGEVILPSPSPYSFLPWLDVANVPMLERP